MAAATVRASWFGGASTEPAGASAEGSTMKFNRVDTFDGVTPIPIPTSVGTATRGTS